MRENNLGWLYQNGRGVAQDYAQAVEWYRKAAEQGDAMRNINLGCDVPRRAGRARRTTRRP